MVKRNVHIALLMMVKNEHKRLHVTLNSVLGYVDSILLYDTGSEDNTIEIASSFCEKNNIPFRLKQGVFVDFSTSRNVSLDFGDTFEDIDFLLLLDTNDELRGGVELRKFCESQIDTPDNAYMLTQEWWSGQYIKYFNTRMVKARKGWRYVGKVHEYIENTLSENQDKVTAPDKIVIYQDRTADDDKSSKRFERDKILLLEDYKEKPDDTRTVFYLAQTLSCLGDFEEALKYYSIRSKMGGFYEENFESLLRCGDLTAALGRDWYESMSWYLKAFEHTTRAEPLVKISQYYKDKNWLLCYTFTELACKLEYPTKCVLFVDKQAYEYTRWHLLGISGWYAGFYEQGKVGCIKAIETGINVDLNQSNLKFYLDKELENKKIIKDKLRKKTKKR